MSKLHRILATIVLAVMGTVMAWAVNPPSVYYDSYTRTFTMSCIDAATIYYTVDGTDPSTSSKRYKYTEPFQINRSLNVWAAAEKDGEWSSVAQYGTASVESRFLNNNIYFLLVFYICV